MDEQADAVTVPHAFGRFPLNVGAALMPAVWGLAHGVVAGLLVQLAGSAVLVVSNIAVRQEGTLLPAVGRALLVLALAIVVRFGLVADGLAVRRRPDRDPKVYAENERMWAVGAVVFTFFVLWYRSIT